MTFCLCFSEFYKKFFTKNEGKCLLFPSKGGKLRWETKHHHSPIPLTKILPKNGAAETRVTQWLSCSGHEGKQGPCFRRASWRHTPGALTVDTLILFLETYSKDVPDIQARLSSSCYYENKKLQTTLMSNCWGMVWITAQLNDGMLCNHWKQSFPLISNMRKFRITTL